MDEDTENGYGTVCNTWRGCGDGGDVEMEMIRRWGVCRDGVDVQMVRMRR